MQLLHCNKTIKHLFFNCQHAKVIWRAVQVATGLTPPRSVTHMLGNRLQNFNAQEAFTIITGTSALCWAIWRCRNDIIFDNVIFSGGTYTGCDFGQFCSMRRGQKSVQEGHQFFASNQQRHPPNICMIRP